VSPSLQHERITVSPSARFVVADSMRATAGASGPGLVLRVVWFRNVSATGGRFALRYDAGSGCR
jgi:hypothetical protein